MCKTRKIISGTLLNGVTAICSSSSNLNLLVNQYTFIWKGFGRKPQTQVQGVGNIQPMP